MGQSGWAMWCGALNAEPSSPELLRRVGRVQKNFWLVNKQVEDIPDKFVSQRTKSGWMAALASLQKFVDHTSLHQATSNLLTPESGVAIAAIGNIHVYFELHGTHAEYDKEEIQAIIAGLSDGIATIKASGLPSLAKNVLLHQLEDLLYVFEPPRACRRRFGLSYAAACLSSSLA
jgi:hypothetical protein